MGMKGVRIFITGLLAFVWGAGGAAAAGREGAADGVFTEDSVYKYTFSDVEKARRIMVQLREQSTIPAFRLDIAEGDLHYNTGKCHNALRFYLKALDSDSVQASDRRYMEQVHRLISCYDCLHNEVKKAQYVRLLFDKARRCGDKAMQSIALFNMGKMLYYQSNKDKGYEYMQQAITLMGESGYKYRYDNLRYNYNTLLVFQEADRKYEEALHTLKALEQVVAAGTGEEKAIEGLDGKEMKALYAHYAVVLLKLGRNEEAERYYRLFLSVCEEFGRDNYLIMPYLFGRKMYDEVIRMNSAREKHLISLNDTINYYMTTIKRSLGAAYRNKGDYKAAAHYFEQLAVLRDSIKNREQKSAALELAALYETHEKDLLIRQQHADMRMRNLWLGFACCVASLLGVLLWRTVRYNRITSRKNEAMVGTIEKLLVYKESLYRKREENLALQKLLQESRKERTSAAKSDGGERKADDDRLLFEKVEHEITTRMLFLQPAFSRDELIKTVYIPKNKFAQLFKQYAGMSFPKYINNLRLEYAAKMLKEYPDYTIDTVARECGMYTVQTFHRLFLERFGVTPAEYRAEIKRSALVIR